VSVHRDDERLRQREQLEHHARERGHEAVGVFAPAVREAEQIDTRGEDGVGAGEDDCARIGRSGDFGNGARDRVDEFEVESAGLSVREPEGGDAVMVGTFDHDGRV
jgi:hypothetical protein